MRKKSFTILNSIMRIRIIIIINTSINNDFKSIYALASYIFKNTNISKMSEQKLTMH